MSIIRHALKHALIPISVLLAASMLSSNAQAQAAGRYANVNGIRMYYEIHGSGEPLVLIHGGGSTIETSFGRLMPRSRGRDG